MTPLQIEILELFAEVQVKYRREIALQPVWNATGYFDANERRKFRRATDPTFRAQERRIQRDHDDRVSQQIRALRDRRAPYRIEPPAVSPMPCPRCGEIIEHREGAPFPPPRHRCVAKPISHVTPDLRLAVVPATDDSLAIWLWWSVWSRQNHPPANDTLALELTPE